MKAIEGDIGATPYFSVTEVLSPQGRRSKDSATRFHARENDLPFLTNPVHPSGFADYNSNDKFPCNLNDMRLSHGTSDWRRRPRFRGRNHRRQNQIPRLDRRFLGPPVLAPEGFHPGLHDRAWRAGQAETRI